jgi:uncharacterized protein YndB with AHSA1/START domain
MSRVKSDSKQPAHRDQSSPFIPTEREDSGLRIEPTADPDCELSLQIRTNTSPEIVFDLLTNAERMKRWLARDVKANPWTDGIIRLTDFSGLWVEGAYLVVAPLQVVVFTWGGIEGLRPGQSTVKVTIHPDGIGTLVRLHQFGLSNGAVHLHNLCWRNWGLPKLKSVAEGAEPGVTCLSEIADWREQHSYSAPTARER